ncbi:MAG: DUF4921 family protein [Deltaproteobacteria bacterium]|nr:DUF4921 family protein [Deltaproteobacteria bacterium]
MYHVQYHQFLHEMPDGTLKMTNPLTGRTAWWVPGRSGRPIENRQTEYARGEIREPEDYCAFCPVNLRQTPPEIDRRIYDGNQCRTVSRPMPSDMGQQPFLFRRVANLYEIVTLEYWRRNYDYRGLARRREWAAAYKNDPAGREHLLELIRTKRKNLRAVGEDMPEISAEAMLTEADSFFLGCHQLISAYRHYRVGADKSDTIQLCGSGCMTPDEHFEYFQFTADSIRDIYECNRYVRYVVAFQNWLAPAGASFDHLHKQLVGLDDWGTSISREVLASRSDPNFYNAQVVNFSSYNNLVMAENQHASLFADFGHRNPTAAVYSKSHHLRPFEHSPEELRGVSDLVHACHAAQGPKMSCNEEWYYQPRDCLEKIPFHVLIKWRVSNPAGFEGGTRIFINPMRPTDIRDQIVPELFRLRAEGRIAHTIQIAEECPVQPNSLRYNR